jgi:hypothetical protein
MNNLFAQGLVNFITWIIIKSAVVWFLWGMLVPAPFTFLPALSFGESFLLVILLEFLMQTNISMTNTMVFRNINYIANSMYDKEKLIQKMVTNLLNNKTVKKDVEEVHDNQKDKLD